MSTGCEIRSYGYVNPRYERVRDALRQNAFTLFQSATKAAASRAQSIAAELHVDFGGIGVKTNITYSSILQDNGEDVKVVQELCAMPLRGSR
jgi:hypothetical protein